MKPLVLLIPGLDGTGRLYYRQLDALEPRYRILPWAFRNRLDFDFADLVEELDQETRDEEPGTMIVVGESFGGVIAMHYALAYPGRARLLALINTFPYYRRRVRIRLGVALSPALQWKCTQRLKNWLVDRVLTAEGILPEDRRRYREIIQRVDAEAYRRRLSLTREVDLREQMRQIKTPTLIFASGRDKIVPSVKEARYMASHFSDARLHIFPRAGHALLLTPGFSLADYF